MSIRFKAGIVHSFKLKNCGLKVLLLISALGLQGCPDNRGISNIITGMSFSDRSHRPNPFCDGLDANERSRCTPELLESLSFAEIGKEIVVFPQGLGTCSQASVDFGDGTPPSTFLNPTLNNSSWRAPHTYNGWPGKKLVRVKGDSGCLGDVTKEITVGIGPNGLEDFKLGFCLGSSCPASSIPVTTVCSIVSPSHLMPPIRKGSGVRIETNGHMINYGSNQIFNASGDPSAPTPLSYLFPNRHKFSIVYRIGTTNFQGEAGPVTFIADQSAPLEVCTNDNPSYLTDNDGNMLFTITVNERSAQ